MRRREGEGELAHDQSPLEVLARQPDGPRARSRPHPKRCPARRRPGRDGAQASSMATPTATVSVKASTEPSMPISPVRTVKRFGVLHQEVEPEHGQRRPSAGAGQREDEVLGEELDAQAPPSGPQRGAHRQLPLPPHQPGEREVRDVRARQQQHEPDRPHEQEEGGPRLRG